MSRNHLKPAKQNQIIMQKTFTCITILLLSNLTLSSITRVDPNVKEGTYLVDKRDVNKPLIEYENVKTTVTSSKEIDLTPAAASAMFREMHSTDVLEGERDMRMRYILHENVGTDVAHNRFLEEWSMRNNNNGFYKVQVRMRMLDLGNLELEDGIQEQILAFTCKHYPEQDVYVCIPDKCDFKGLIPPATPVQICVNNYRQSQMLLDTVKTSTSTQEPTIVGEQTQDLIVRCMEEYIETITVQGEHVCYYEGFKPENMVSYDDLKKKIMASGEWQETDKVGSFQRTTVIKEWEVVSTIDTSIPALVEKYTDVKKDISAEELETIYEEFGTTELKMDNAVLQTA